MKRMIALVAAGLVVSASVVLTAMAQDDKTPPTNVIMKKLHGGKTSHKAKVQNLLKAATPDWEALDKEAKQYVVLSEALGKNEPEKGDKGHWDMLTKNFLEASKALQTASEGKNKSDAQAAFKKLTTSCKTCHDAHKGE
jgi:hypothetical protein